MVATAKCRRRAWYETLQELFDIDTEDEAAEEWACYLEDTIEDKPLAYDEIGDASAFEEVAAMGFTTW